MEEIKSNRFQRFPSGIWFPVFTLAALGLLFVYSSSSVYASQKFGDEFFFVRKQFIFFILGVGCAFLGMKCRLETLLKHSKVLLLIAIVLVLATHLPGLGKKVGGASRWLYFGFFQVQPSELMKVAALLYTVNCIVTFPKEKILNHLWPIYIGLVALLSQPDFGNTLVTMVCVVSLLFLGGFRIRYFVYAALAVIPALIGLVAIAPYRLKRVMTFLDPFADPQGAGFQIIQSLTAIATGGMFGKGLGGSQQKLFFLPEAHTDFILSVVAEETGLAGVLIILFMFTLFLLTVLQISFQIKKQSAGLVMAGVFVLIGFSVMVNMAVVSSMLPTKGLPLPFVSSGGSHICTNFFLVGFISRLYRDSLVENRE